jgi:hypothetical protein
MTWFRSSKSEQDRVVDETLKRLFPGGAEEMRIKRRVVYDLCGGKISEEAAAQVLINAKYGFWLAQSQFDGVSNLGIAYAEFLQLIEAGVGASLSSFEAAAVGMFAIFGKTDTPPLNCPEALQNFLATLFGADDMGCDGDVVPSGVGEFGFEATNPIPVRGLASTSL